MTHFELHRILTSIQTKGFDETISNQEFSDQWMIRAFSYWYKIPCMHHILKSPRYVEDIPYMYFLKHEIYAYDEINHKGIFLLKDPRKENIIRQGYHQPYHVYLISQQLEHDIHIKFSFYYRIYDILQKLKNLKKSADQFLYHQQLMEHLFLMAIAMDASDIHFIKTHTKGEVLFRIQGHRSHMFSFDIVVMDHILRRLKVLANLEINNHMDAQDGIFNWTKHAIHETFRLATMPTPHGEQMMLRMIQQEGNMKTIDSLGFTEIQKQYVYTQLKKKQGLIFVSGSTGSGKTTTLYACLKELKQMPLHIVTLEDPIEIEMAHVSQMQLDPNKNMLKHIMRYDPDVIMIGEIRDHESAKAAIEAALSGHLVLASIHVNHPKDIFKRMKQFGINQTMLEDASPLMMHHQLIPIVCQDCKGKGCIKCMFKGHERRQLIIDMMHFIRKVWCQKGDAYDISLMKLKAQHLIDEDTYQQYLLAL
jgi:general secretion pathway protein E